MDQDDGPDVVARSIEAYRVGAAAYEAAYAERYGPIVERFAESLPVPSRILDAGCGPGRDLRRFTARGHEAHGIDLTPEFVARARRHGPVVLGDLRAVATHFPAASFDGVWAAASLVHLPAADAVGVLAQFATLTRPGGRLFVSVRSTGDTGWLDEPDGPRWYRVWTAGALNAAVTAAGFAVDDLTPGPYTEVWATRTGR